MFLCLSFVYTVFLHDSLLIHCSLSPVTSSSFLLFLPSSRLLHLLCIQNTYSSECVWQENQKESCSLTVWDNRPVNHHYLCLCSYVFSSQSQRITPVSRFTSQWVALSPLFLFIPRNDLVLFWICICFCVNLLYELSVQTSSTRTSSDFICDSESFMLLLFSHEKKMYPFDSQGILVSPLHPFLEENEDEDDDHVDVINMKKQQEEDHNFLQGNLLLIISSLVFILPSFLTCVSRSLSRYPLHLVFDRLLKESRKSFSRCIPFNECLIWKKKKKQEKMIEETMPDLTLQEDQKLLPFLVLPVCH